MSAELSKPGLIPLLRALDQTQQQTDEEGGAEIAWYYFRDAVEDALGLDRGALDTGPDPHEHDVTPCGRPDRPGCGHPYNRHASPEEYEKAPCQILGCECGDFA